MKGKRGETPRDNWVLEMARFQDWRLDMFYADCTRRERAQSQLQASDIAGKAGN